MGKIIMFNVAFSNSSGAFYAGTQMQGHVNLELAEPMNMRGIRLCFEGRANVHWTESETTGTGNDRKTHTRHYSSEERYFNQDVLLFGIWPNQGSNTTELASGRHTFPFVFQLPPNLPSSFEGGIGRVRYAVRSVIDKPWKFDHKTKRPFTVISILDLNAYPAYQNNVQGFNQKNLCCLCCKSGPITARFSLERQAYVPGEAIRLFGEISNGSSRKMDKSYVDLKMITTFHAVSKSRMSCTEVARVTRPGIEGYGEDSWTGETLVVPPLPPSFLLGCQIIDIRYILQLNVDPSGPALDLEVPLEVILGTIPLASVVQQYQPMQPPPQVGFEPSAPSDEPDYPTAPPSGIPNLRFCHIKTDSQFLAGDNNSCTAKPLTISVNKRQPCHFAPDSAGQFIYRDTPPSYAECVTGKVDTRDDGDNEHTHGNLSYAPVYTYYNWGHQLEPLPLNGR